MGLASPSWLPAAPQVSWQPACSTPAGDVACVGWSPACCLCPAETPELQHLVPALPLPGTPSPQAKKSWWSLDSPQHWPGPSSGLLSPLLAWGRAVAGLAAGIGASPCQLRLRGPRGDKPSSSRGATSLRGTGTAATPRPCTPQVARESRDGDCEAGGERGRIRLQAARGREIGREQQCSKKGF